MLSALLLVLAASPTHGNAVLARHECNRCHVVEAVAPPPPLQKSCAGCHRDISSSAEDPQRSSEGRRKFGPAWDRFVRRTGGLYVNVPPLVSMERFRPEWLRAFLRAPYDLRPNLSESMIRHAMTDEEIDAVVATWSTKGRAPGAKPAMPSEERLKAGAALFEQKGCGACHLFGNRPLASAGPTQFEPAPRNRSRALAPDLRHARDRYTREMVEAIVFDPDAVLKGAQMPRFGLTREQASLLADFVYFGEFGPPARHKVARLPAYDPSVPVPTWEEVDRAVFRKVCWHCHSNPDFNGGDGGPGNTGGLGFQGAGLSFADYEAFLAGNALRVGNTGEPVLLERLRLRHAENARDHLLPGTDPLDSRAAPSSPAPRGMPLGLPALTPEEFSLVERWVRGGAPGPSHD